MLKNHNTTTTAPDHKTHHTSAAGEKLTRQNCFSIDQAVHNADLLTEHSAEITKSPGLLFTLLNKVGTLEIEGSIDLIHKTQHLAHQILELHVSYPLLQTLLESYIKNKSISRLLNCLVPTEGTEQLITMRQQLINHLLKSRFKPFSLPSEKITQHKPGTAAYKRTQYSIEILTCLHTTAIKQHWKSNTLLLKFIQNRKEFNPNHLTTHKKNRRKPLSVRQLEKRIRIQELLIAIDCAIYQPHKLGRQNAFLLAQQSWALTFIDIFLHYDFSTTNRILSALVELKQYNQVSATALQFKLAENHFNLFQQSINPFPHLERALSSLLHISQVSDTQFKEYQHWYKLISIPYIKRKLNKTRHEADQIIHTTVNSHIRDYTRYTGSQTIGVFFKNAINNSLTVLPPSTQPCTSKRKRNYTATLPPQLSPNKKRLHTG